MAAAASPERYIFSNTSLAIRAADGAVVDQREQPDEVARWNRTGGDGGIVVARQLAQELVQDPVGDGLRLAVGAGRLLEVVGQSPALGEQLGVIGRETVGLREARAARRRQLGQALR